MLQALLRIIIIFVAGFTIWQFSDGFLLAWETLAEPMEAQWFNVLSALCEGVLGPVLALSAIALSVANRRLPLATILAILAGVIYVAPLAAFFIGIAVNYPRRRVPLILFGVTIAAVLHALNDWYLSNFSLPWPWILLQAFSLLLFLGYTMSAASIERRVRRTPLFRGESMIMDKFTETGEQRRA